MTDQTTTFTYGEQLVGITFNPSNDDLVNQIKSKYAEIINMLHSARFEPASNIKIESHTERQRYISIAITEAQTAQMRAVKAVTAK
jgi:hypothetical protein